MRELYGSTGAVWPELENNGTSSATKIHFLLYLIWPNEHRIRISSWERMGIRLLSVSQIPVHIIKLKEHASQSCVI